MWQEIPLEKLVRELRVDQKRFLVWLNRLDDQFSDMLACDSAEMIQVRVH